MKTFQAIILALFLCSVPVHVHANVLVFQGQITQVTGTTSVYKVGDAVMITIHHNPQGAVIRSHVAVNESVINLARSNPGSNVFIDTDPADGFVSWTVFDSGIPTNLHVDVEAQTNGSIPCTSDFFSRGFNFTDGCITVNGEVTAIPISRTGN
jgi:hypothetical protein